MGILLRLQLVRRSALRGGAPIVVLDTGSTVLGGNMFGIPSMPGSSMWRTVLAILIVFSSTHCLGGETRTEDEIRIEGERLESERKWIDAIDLYENWLKDHSNSDAVRAGFRRAKIHYSIERRYSDKSFLDTMLVAGESEALSHFDDVAAKVQKYYVDTVSVTSFVAHGTESVYRALMNEKFLRVNAPGVTEVQTRQMRQTLREKYWNRPAPSLSSGRAIVVEVAEMCQRELGMSRTAIALEYVFGGCNALDDYSSYLTPGRLDDLYNNIDGEFVGIGIEMKAESGRGLSLVNVLPGSPAEEGGLQPKDYVVAIDGKDCRNMTTEEAATLLQGKAGTRVTVTAEDAVTRREYSSTLTRRQVRVKSIPISELLDPVSGIAYIKMTGFQKNTVDEMDAALAKLQREGMQALIWDLRANPGGLLPTAVEVLDRFLEEGVIVSTRGRLSDQNYSYTAQRPGTWKVPLVLVVDGDSASASEIVAGAIRDHQRGTIVGRKTYGKWSVQTILPAYARAGFRITTAKFYSPAGLTYSKVGIAPDVVVEKSESMRVAYRGRDRDNYEDDKDLTTALGVLRQQLARR